MAAERETVIAGLRSCAKGCARDECPYWRSEPAFPGDIVSDVDCCTQLARDALDIVRMDEPYAMTAREFLASEAGTGWAEMKCQPDPDEGLKDTVVLMRIAWVGDCIAYKEISWGTKAQLLGGGDSRVWIGYRAPTEAERTGTPWET